MKSASPPVYDNNSHNICFMNDGFPKARNKKLHCRYTRWQNRGKLQIEPHNALDTYFKDRLSYGFSAGCWIDNTEANETWFLQATAE